jgi:hypothetical protein
MVLAAKKPATYEDLLTVSEHLVAEILDGEPYTSPRPASLHAVAASNLGIEIGVLRLDANSWRIAGTFEGTATVRAEPFDAVELELGSLWAR